MQVNRHLQEGHREAGQQGRLRRNRTEVGVEQVELFLPQLYRALLDRRAQKELVGGEHTTGTVCECTSSTPGLREGEEAPSALVVGGVLSTPPQSPCLPAPACEAQRRIQF